MDLSIEKGSSINTMLILSCVIVQLLRCNKILLHLQSDALA